MAQDIQTAAELADAIRRVAAHSSAAEMDLVVGVEELIRPFLGAGVSLSRYGQATKLGGIKDALHGNLIIEYERPGKLSKRAGLEENVGQLQKYLLEESARHGHSMVKIAWECPLALEPRLPCGEIRCRGQHESAAR